MNRLAIVLILAAGCSSSGSHQMADDALTLHARRGEKTETLTWKPAETAIIICDMWDTHTCAGVVRHLGGARGTAAGGEEQGDRESVHGKRFLRL